MWCVTVVLLQDKLEAWSFYFFWSLKIRPAVKKLGGYNSSKRRISTGVEDFLEVFCAFNKLLAEKPAILGVLWLKEEDFNQISEIWQNNASLTNLKWKYGQNKTSLASGIKYIYTATLLFMEKVSHHHSVTNVIWSHNISHLVT